MSRDAVSSEQHLFYEDNARRALSGTLMEAFGLRVREPERGFNADFSSRESPKNLLWISEPTSIGSTHINRLEIDFLGHTEPLEHLPEVNEGRVNQMRHVRVFKSMATEEGVQATIIVGGGQQKKADSPEKATEGIEGDGDDGEMIQYVVAEITHGGKTSTRDKIRQLQRACLFLSSRASPTVENVSDLNVLAAVACVVVVSPAIDHDDIFKYVEKTKLQFPMVHTLMAAGRLVCIKYTQTLTAIVSDTATELSELRTVTQALLAETQAQNAEMRGTLDSMMVLLQKVLQSQAAALPPPPPPATDMAPDKK